MTDNYEAGSGSSGPIFASDEVATIHHPRVKVEWGANNTASDVSLAAPLPMMSSLEASQMMFGGVAVTPKFAIISASSSGNNTLVAAVSGKKIRVLALNLSANGSVNLKFQSGASGTDLTGLSYMIVNVNMILPYNPVGWFQTLVNNTLLNLNLSAAISVGGTLVYIEV